MGLELVAEEERDLSSTIRRDVQSNHLPHRARLLFKKKDSLRESVVDVVSPNRSLVLARTKG
jgi:hypothetical protein